MRAFVKVYHRRPSFVVIWFRGRTNAAVADYCREHNRRMARDLFHVARSAGMVVEGSDGLYAELAVEVADRMFQIAFEDSAHRRPARHRRGHRAGHGLPRDARDARRHRRRSRSRTLVARN